MTDECYAKYRVHGDSCVSRSTRAGRNDDATRRFLIWLEDYLRRQAIRDPAIWRSLRPHSDPTAFRISLLCRIGSGICAAKPAMPPGGGTTAWSAPRQKSTATITAGPNPVFTSDRYSVGETRLSWRTNQASTVEVRVNVPDGPLLASSTTAEYSQNVPWVTNGTCFYLQDVTGGRPLTSENTLDIVRVRVVPVITPDALAPHEMPPEGVHDEPPTVHSKAADAALASESASAGSKAKQASKARAVILLYHRIANVRSDPWTLAVTPEHFDEQLKVLREWGNVVSLTNLRSRLIDGDVPIARLRSPLTTVMRTICMRPRYCLNGTKFPQPFLSRRAF